MTRSNDLLPPLRLRLRLWLLLRLCLFVRSHPHVLAFYCDHRCARNGMLALILREDRDALSGAPLVLAGLPHAQQAQRRHFARIRHAMFCMDLIRAM
jgi:hypothetical protein